jgi:hypothetical protein
MKRVFYSFVLSVLFCAFYGSAEKVLPLSVQQFLEERAWSGSAGMCQYSQYASPRVIDGVEMIDAFIAIDDESTLTAFFKQKTAYEIVERGWSSDVCSSDL